MAEYLTSIDALPRELDTDGNYPRLFAFPRQSCALPPLICVSSCMRRLSTAAPGCISGAALDVSRAFIHYFLRQSLANFPPLERCQGGCRESRRDLASLFLSYMAYVIFSRPMSCLLVRPQAEYNCKKNKQHS